VGEAVCAASYLFFGVYFWCLVSVPIFSAKFARLHLFSQRIHTTYADTIFNLSNVLQSDNTAKRQLP